MTPQQFRSHLRDEPHLEEALARMEEHLRNNKVLLSDIRYRVGRRLKVDATTETIVGDSEANRLLFREYRKPFVVPDKVV
jgi:hypothetical protein